jgi:TetR/AcrR family transcriptional repressor of nem operon
MRYESAHKEQTRQRIVAEASRAIRIDGPHRIGVAGIMAKAGLTHGGFYLHFKSKDDLVIAALSNMFDEARATRLRWTDGKQPADALRDYIGFYLSPAHRDAVGKGCPVAALSADLPRLSMAARQCFAGGVTRLTDTLTGLLSDIGVENAQATARSVLAELAGALSLARSVADPAQSDEILACSHAHLMSRLGLIESA